MKRWSLFLLRLSIGLLVFWWGLDKVTNVEHALQVSETFYTGLLSHPVLTPGGLRRPSFLPPSASSRTHTTKIRSAECSRTVNQALV